MTPQAVDQLVVHAENVTIHKEPPRPSEVKDRIRKNAIWLLAAIFLVGFWFSLHLRTYVSRLLVFGLPALWAAWQTAMAWTKKDLEDDIKDARKRFLAREKTNENLQFVCLLAVLALVLTSSFFIDLGSTSLPRATIEVYDAAGARLLPPITLDSSKPMKGKVFLPWLWRDKLRLVVTDPPGYILKDPKPLSFFPTKAVNLTFDDVFQKEELFALRLIPSADLKVPFNNNEDGRVVIRDEKGQVLNDVQVTAYRSICVGMTDPTKLATAFAGENDADFAALLSRELTRPPEFVAPLQTAPIIDPSKRNFVKGERLTVSVTGTWIEPSVMPVTVGTSGMSTFVLRPTVNPPVPEEEEEVQ